jgi:hypothetical protein
MQFLLIFWEGKNGKCSQVKLRIVNKWLGIMSGRLAVEAGAPAMERGSV